MIEVVVSGTEAGTFGTDVVMASASYQPGAGQLIEVLQLTGTANIDATGNEFDNTLIGNCGDTVLSVDTGNDVYFVQNAGDVVMKSVGQGVDVINANVTYALTPGQEFEVLQLADGLNINGIGNSGSNTIIGSNGLNWLQGGAGDDTLIGLASNDVLIYFPGDGRGTMLYFTELEPRLVTSWRCSNSGFTSFAQLLQLLSDAAGGSQLTFNASDSIFLLGVVMAQLDASDFAFL